MIGLVKTKVLTKKGSFRTTVNPLCQAFLFFSRLSIVSFCLHRTLHYAHSKLVHVHNMECVMQ